MTKKIAVLLAVLVLVLISAAACTANEERVVAQSSQANEDQVIAQSSQQTARVLRSRKTGLMSQR